MVMEFASSRAPSSRLKSKRPTSTGRPKLASRCAIRYRRAAAVRKARESPMLAANSTMARMKIQRSHFRLRILRSRIVAKDGHEEKRRVSEPREAYGTTESATADEESCPGNSTATH